MSGRCRAPQRIVAALAAVVVATVVALVAPVHGAGGSLAWGPSCAEAAPAQATINIGMVVDFGVLDPGAVSVTCVPVAPGTNGFSMLTAAGHTFRQNSSGLVCAIDGLPADGCGERTPGGYRYWAYFHGSGSSWSYSSIGPQSYRAAAGTVEGWHFVEGAGNPSDPPPARPPTNICPAAPPPTVAPTTAPPPMPAPPTTAPAPAPTPTPTAPSTPGAPGGQPTGPNGAPAPSVTTSSTAPGAAPADRATTVPPGELDPALAPPGSDPAGSADPSASPGTTTVDEDGVASDVVVLASAQNPSADGGGGGAPIATILGVVVVAGLGAAAAWRFRGRSDATA